MPIRRVSVVGRSLLQVLLLSSAMLVLGVGPALAGDIVISGGSLDMNPTAGPLSLSGDRGFTFESHVSVTGGVFAPYEDCNLFRAPCFPGETISLRGFWSGTDVSGSATLDGISYPRVGDREGMAVEFTGSVVLPPFGLGPEQTITAPFLLTGGFSHDQIVERLYGNGIATVSLAIDHAFGDRWLVRRVVYELFPAVPAPWVSKDIGSVSTRGLATYSTGNFVVSGDGSDIWGSADSFQFVYQDVDASEITGHVMYQQFTHRFAKAGLMLRGSTDPGAPGVILDVKPDGGLEFMARYATSEPMVYLGGALAAGPRVFLKLVREAGNVVTGYQSLTGDDWQVVGSASVPFPASRVLAGLAVTSHDRSALNTARFNFVEITRSTGTDNLLIEGDFEGYVPPALGAPGWVSDDLLRQTAAKSETHQPRSGVKNGACWTPERLDCGIYQEVVAPASGTYAFVIFASADRAGGLVGVNVNGVTAASRDVSPRNFGDYARYDMTFTANAGEVIRVWMYSPSVPGYVVIDDASLAVQTAPQ